MAFAIHFSISDKDVAVGKALDTLAGAGAILKSNAAMSGAISNVVEHMYEITNHRFEIVAANSTYYTGNDDIYKRVWNTISNSGVSDHAILCANKYFDYMTKLFEGANKHIVAVAAIMAFLNADTSFILRNIENAGFTETNIPYTGTTPIEFNSYNDIKTYAEAAKEPPTTPRKSSTTPAAKATTTVADKATTTAVEKATATVVKKAPSTAEAATSTVTSARDPNNAPLLFHLIKKYFAEACKRAGIAEIHDSALQDAVTKVIHPDTGDSIVESILHSRFTKRRYTDKFLRPTLSVLHKSGNKTAISLFVNTIIGKQYVDVLKVWDPDSVASVTRKPE